MDGAEVRRTIREQGEQGVGDGVYVTVLGSRLLIEVDRWPQCNHVTELNRDELLKLIEREGGNAKLSGAQAGQAVGGV